MNRALCVLGASLGILSACGDDGGRNASLETQVAALQTQLAAPTQTATPPPTAEPSPTPPATPTPDTSAFCTAVLEFVSTRNSLVRRGNELLTVRNFTLTKADGDELKTLLAAVTRVRVPLPAKDSAPNIQRLNALVLALKAAYDRLVNAAASNNTDSYNAVRNDLIALNLELNQLIDAECPH
jgi:hypothetical protein